MNRIARMSAAFSMSVFFAGCGIGLGLFPKSSYEALHPKPYRSLWAKNGTTEEARRTDWAACGGQANGNFGFDRSKRLPDESQDAFQERQESDFQRCIIQAGYHYTGDCSSAYMKARPLCGAP